MAYGNSTSSGNYGSKACWHGYQKGSKIRPYFAMVTVPITHTATRTTNAEVLSSKKFATFIPHSRDHSLGFGCATKSDHGFRGSTGDLYVGIRRANFHPKQPGHESWHGESQHTDLQLSLENHDLISSHKVEDHLEVEYLLEAYYKNTDAIAESANALLGDLEGLYCALQVTQ
jgi:hypothetical protein